MSQPKTKNSKPKAPSPAEIQEAARILEGRVIRTPVVHSPTLSRLAKKFEVYLKLENLQVTGSFKIRGATYKILTELDRIGKGGVVAASAGNHAQGVALAASRAGLRSTIVMPEWASISKQEATRGYGGEVILEGKSVDDSIKRALELAKEGRTFIHPFDDPSIIAGQGSIGLEILEDLPDADVIAVPVGGGGLISGISTAVRSLKPGIRIVGVQAGACPSALKAFNTGARVKVEALRSIADGIAVKRIGRITFDIVSKQVDEIVLADEDRIAEAVIMLLERKKILAEGAGAVCVAALLSGAIKAPQGAKAVLVISGGNIDISLLDRVIRKGLSRNGRIMRFAVRLDDVPGALAKLLGVIAAARANVLQINHNRGGAEMSIHQSEVELEIETRNFEHNRAIEASLKRAGYDMERCPPGSV
ncbi:MAG TPA: threonine ammonia-lyase [Syntrophobacteraceae bacterium]|nr:threonine ammonia-lyase [Syntrophobacteraceae bacterium]